MAQENVEGHIEKILREALQRGAEFADARLQEYEYETLVYDKDRLRERSYTKTHGLGIRVVYKGYHGYSSTTRLSEENVKKALEEALNNAKALSLTGVSPNPLAEYPAIKDTAKSTYMKDPFTISDQEKIEVARKLVETAMETHGVQSAISRVGLQRDRRLVINTEGLRVETEVVMTGVAITAVAMGTVGLEYVSDHYSKVKGWEYIESLSLDSIAQDVARLSIKAANARAPKPGKYKVVLEPEVVGLLMHEALGHASEADLVLGEASVLKGRLGEKIAAEGVTIVDDGRHPDGYYVPYDDEGVRKEKTIIVNNGVLKGLLTGRTEAKVLGLKPTGNSRVMSFRHPIQVRQTNYYLEPGDWSVEEILEEAGKNAILVTAKGSKGGEVDPGMGTFTFSVGISWRLEKGEPVEPLRGVSIAGMILDVLKNITAIGRDLKVSTSVFGGCGKGGQLVRVGDGGPHILVKELVVGGR